jgi:glycosyltransferase involved in cell wall biosynthesis
MPKRTHVVHLITLLEMGGAQGNTIFTVKHLDPNHYVAHLWAGRGAYFDKEVKVDLDLAGRLRFFPRLVRPIHPLFDLVAVIELWWALRKLKPKILHTHSSKAGIVGRLAGWLARVPIIIHTYHGFGFNEEQKPWTRWFFILLEKGVAKLSTQLIFVSHSNMETARQCKIGRDSQYVLIRSGVSLQSLRTRASQTDRFAVKSSLQIPDDAHVILTVGPFKPQKNLSDFIQLGRELLNQQKNVHLLMIGDGESRPMLEKMAKNLKMEQQVHMPGWRKDMPEILSISDIFVLTSLWEGLPRALVESMAMGIPAVCYETDGVTDLLSRGGGFLAKKKDREALTQSVLTLLNDNALRAKCSAQAKDLIGMEFEINYMVRQQEALYAELLNRLPASAAHP